MAQQHGSARKQGSPQENGPGQVSPQQDSGKQDSGKHDSGKQDSGKQGSGKQDSGEDQGQTEKDSSAPGTETWISSLMLSPREVEKMIIYQVAEIARRRKERGVKLNFPESIAVICEAVMEAARDGRSVADVQDLGRKVLTRDDVMPEVPSMVTMVQVEATFRTGTQLISVSHPIP